MTFPLDGVSLDDPILDGPRLRPRNGGAPDSLVVLLHGYGADGRDLIDIGNAWADLLPGALFVSPHAPDPCAGAPVGRQWFPLTFRDPHELTLGAEGAAPLLRDFLAEELAKYDLPPERLALVGFSQGAMMALKLATTAQVAPAAVVAYSGMWVDAGRSDIQLPVRPPVLLVHGSEDEVIPAQALFASARGLAAAGVPVEWHLSQGLGHGIDDEGLFHGGQFLAEFLGKARP
ncbi:alpha/beta hydrolase [Xanthobacter oligotrophicus]|uniref:alpha/beta hydrolase n=1 Tax=Xanthobacter oligotrophicus TaxID=2607286 RepID=UPI0011F221C1|nr:prolyl oligopeptidase family serine peptidase [Xanthobacter oligotrophicus]MCG5237329.1 prolyl oligopeptidase family serine peptidase [Xanthobacter oligotrophicus]